MLALFGLFFNSYDNLLHFHLYEEIKFEIFFFYLGKFGEAPSILYFYVPKYHSSDTLSSPKIFSFLFGVFTDFARYLCMFLSKFPHNIQEVSLNF